MKKQEIEVICHYCSCKVMKPLKEHRRRIKHGQTRFFCNRKCSGSISAENLPRNRGYNQEHMLKMVERAAEKNRIYTKEQQPFQRILRKTTKRCFANDLNLDFLQSLWKKQNGICALSNIPLILDGNDYNTKASLDRIDSSRGYLQDNVQFVSCAINLAKRDSSNDAALTLIDLIVKYYQPKISLALSDNME